MTADASQYCDSVAEINPERIVNLADVDLSRCHDIARKNKHRIHYLIEAVAAEAFVPARDILGKSRRASVCEARHLVMYLASQEGIAQSTIASYLNRDHTTVSHGIRAEKRRRGE